MFDKAPNTSMILSKDTQDEIIPIKVKLYGVTRYWLSQETFLAVSLKN